MISSNRLLTIYNQLLKKLGKQNWWPLISKSKSKKNRQFEICVGAILTQNTSWKQAEKALKNLDNAKVLNEKNIRKISAERLSSLIKPSGFYRQKALKLKNFVEFLENYPFRELEKMPLEKARNLLLKVKGIGNETCDCILLYALNKPSFVIDKYTKKVFSKKIMKNVCHRTSKCVVCNGTHFCDPKNFTKIFGCRKLKVSKHAKNRFSIKETSKLKNYDEWKNFFEKNLPRDVYLYKEYHALIVECAKKSKFI